MSQMTILFDLDGTLVDSLQDLTNAVNYARQHFALPPISTDQTMSYIGDGQLNLVKRAFADAKKEIDIQQPLKTLQVYYQEHLLDCTRLFPGVRETLQKLSARCKLEVVTNKQQDAAEQVCQGLGIAEFLCSIVGGGRTANLKPHPEPLLLALQLAGGHPENTWMVGDHYTDLAAAAAAGCKSCFCNFGYGQTRQEHPDCRIDQFSDLLKILML